MKFSKLGGGVALAAVASMALTGCASSAPAASGPVDVSLWTSPTAHRDAETAKAHRG